MNRDTPLPDGLSPISRRSWVATTSGLVAAALVRTQADAWAATGALGGGAPAQSSDPPASELGSRAPQEHLRRLVTGDAPRFSNTPIHELYGNLTPADLHYEWLHSGVARVDPEGYALTIDGMVDRPLTLTLADLKRTGSVTRTHFLECFGNGRAGFGSDLPTDLSAQQLDGWLSTSEWTGVPLARLLEQAGVRSGASWMIAYGGDRAEWTQVVPLLKGMDDALIAYGQNGEAIRPAQGYPARLFLPGWEGMRSVKWLRRIEITDRPAPDAEQARLLRERAANGSFVMDAKSVITFPSFPYVLPERGWWEIRGLAWSGRGRIVGVDVSTDGGRTWTPAEIQTPTLPKSSVVFRHLWNWDGRDALILSRAADETGYVQPSHQALAAARDEGRSYHYNNLRAWKVARDGATTFGVGELL